MAKQWSYSEDRKHIVLAEPPKQKLRISGHRFATVLGLNEYSSQFQAWAEITKTVSVPFVENKYIIAGRIVEPVAIDYVRNKFPNIKSMEEYYGNSIDEYRYNNFKNESNIFGGVFDFVSTKNNGKDIAMIGEVKTTSHPEYFENNNVPITYSLQAALYAKLKGLDRVLFVICFLDDMDYAHPENFVPNETNTKLIVKKLNEMFFEIDGEYLGIDACMEKAKQFWYDFVDTGISPPFDEKIDKEYLDIIRASQPSNDNSLEDLCIEAIKIAKDIKEKEETSGINNLKKELKVLETSIKNTMIEKDIDMCNKYKLKREIKYKFNEEEFAKRNEKIYNDYCEEIVSYKLSKNLKEEE